MTPLSPGLLVGSFELLRLTRLTALPFRELPGAFSKLGGVPTKEVLAVAQNLNWIAATALGNVELTPAGQRIADLQDHRTRMRAAILDYIEIVRPSWLQAAASGRRRVLLVAGAAVAQVFDEADLISGADESTVAFWDSLGAQARGLRNDHLTRIGRIGERASLEYERTRTGREPKWVSLESNADGYDVLSIVGKSDPRPLSIEVKTTSLSSGGRFFLTKNEWERATKFGDHVFHLWRLKENRAVTPPSIVSVATLEPHVPLDQGTGCWESVAIPFDDFCPNVLG